MILLALDPLSSLAYPMITHTPLPAGNLPIKTLVAMQRPTNIVTAMHVGCNYFAVQIHYFIWQCIQLVVTIQSVARGWTAI